MGSAYALFLLMGFRLRSISVCGFPCSYRSRVDGTPHHPAGAPQKLIGRNRNQGEGGYHPAGAPAETKKQKRSEGGWISACATARPSSRAEAGASASRSRASSTRKGRAS